MENTKHTPGKWESQDGLVFSFINKSHVIILSDKESEANAALLAAAPELLEYAILEDEFHKKGFVYINEILYKGTAREKLDGIRTAAIAKATNKK